MKSLIKTLAALVAASAALAACQTAPVESVETNRLIKMVEFTTDDVETRTAFTEPDGNSYPVRWTANDTDVAIFPNDFSLLQKAVVEPSADGRTAKFHASFALVEDSSYKFFFLSPSSALDESGSGTTVTLTVPTDQYPTALSPDENAQILYSKSKTFNSVPDAVTFSPLHLTSYIKLSLTNVAASIGNIGYVQLTSSEFIAGKARLTLDPQHLERDGGTASHTVTSYVDNLTDVWFGILPTQVAGTKLTVTVSGSKGTLVREVTLPDKDFSPGKVAVFTVDMKTATPSNPSGDQVFGRIDEARFVTEGAQFVIATAADDLSWAIGTTQGTDARAGVAVTKSKTGTRGEEPLETIIGPSDEVEVLTVEAGTVDGAYAFKTKAGKYLAIDQSKNAVLVSADTKSALTDWRVRYNNGVCEFRCVAPNNYTFYLRYRKSDNKFVAMRTSFASNGEPIALYKLEGTGGSGWKLEPELHLSKTNLTLTEGETKRLAVALCYSLDDGGVVTFRSDDPTVATVSDKGDVTAVKAGETMVWAHVNETDNYQEDSVACKITVLPPVPVQSITFCPKLDTMFVGETKKLSLIVSPPNAYYTDVRWWVQPESLKQYLSVDEKGNVTGLKASPGLVTVKVSVKDADNNYWSSTCLVRVAEPYAIESFTLSPDELNLKVGQSKYVSLVVMPTDAEICETTYASEDESVATFTNGVVKAVGAGETSVSATILTKDGRRWTAYCKVTVGKAPVLKVQYAWSASETATWTDYVDPVAMSATYQACYFRLYDSSNKTVIKSGQFSRYHTSYPSSFSSNVEVYGGYMWRIVLETNGFLEETLICKDEGQGIDFEQRVIVYIPRPLALSLDSDRSTVFTSGGTVPVQNGSTRTLYIRHKDERREQYVDRQLLSITGGDTSIATIDADQTVVSTLTITAKRQGTTTFRIKYDQYGMTLDTYVKVNVFGPVTKVTINQRNDANYYYNDLLNLDIGDVLQMSATVEGGAGEGVTWSLATSADTISVNATTGRIQGAKYGSAYLRATSVEDPTVSDVINVYVWEPATEIRIAQPVRVKPGDTQKLYYVVEPSLKANQRIKFETPGYYAPQVHKWTIGSTVTESSGWRTVALTPPSDEKINAGNLNYGTSSKYATYIQTWNGKQRKEVSLAVVQYYKTETKPMDYLVLKKDNTHTLRSMDGGLRIIQDFDGRALIDETSINISTTEEVVAVIHKINSGIYSYGNSYTVVNGKLTNATDTHGVAVAITDNGKKIRWSEDSDDVPNASDWPSGQAMYPTCQVTSVNSSQQNGLPLSASAVYYNKKRGDSHEIQPENEIVTYQKNHTVYEFRHPLLTGGNDPTVPGWFVPTIAEWYDLKCYTAEVHNGILANIGKAGGSFPNTRDYWLIECYDKNNAWYATYQNGAYHDKKKSAADCYVRPFIRF